MNIKELLLNFGLQVQKLKLEDKVVLFSSRHNELEDVILF